MKYHYLPLSAVAYERATAPYRPAAPPTHIVLETLELPSREAPALARKVEAAGGWARCIKVLAEETATCTLVESVSVRVRLLGLGGYAMWIDGRAAGASVLRPYRKRVTHEQLEVALGLLTIAYGTCTRWIIPWVRPCGQTDIRINKDGSLRAHKTPWGSHCR